MRPPVEAGLASNEIAVVAERDAPVGDDGVELGEGLEVLVDDRLVHVDPEGLGGLQLRRVEPAPAEAGGGR